MTVHAGLGKRRSVLEQEVWRVAGYVSEVSHLGLSGTGARGGDGLAVYLHRAFGKHLL